MTIAQIIRALTPTAKIGAIQEMTPHEAESFVHRKQRQRTEWIERQIGPCP
jgi:hypothetical protein